MSSIPGSEYYDFGNGRWRDNANETWSQNHTVNPQTGELEGDYPLPPAEVARGYQAMHDRAVWNYRRRLMDQGRGQMADATNYQKGALGLLQSYRAGGSAALESGIYNQVAGGMRAEGAASFQQAEMTQPLDLLSDLRRHESTLAQRKADRASERQMIAQIVSSNSQSLQSGSSMGGGGDGGGGGGGMSLAYTPEGQNGQSATGETAFSAGLEDPYTPDGQQQSPLQSQQQQSQQSPFAGAAQQGQGQDGGLGMNTVVEPFDQQGGGIGAGAGGGGGAQQPGGGGGVGAGAPMAGSFGAPGADGNFSSDSFAAASAAATVNSPMGSMARVDLNHTMADMYESDPFYQSLPTAIHAEWQKRLQGQTA